MDIRVTRWEWLSLAEYKDKLKQHPSLLGPTSLSCVLRLDPRNDPEVEKRLQLYLDSGANIELALKNVPNLAVEHKQLLDSIPTCLALVEEGSVKRKKDIRVRTVRAARTQLQVPPTSSLEIFDDDFNEWVIFDDIKLLKPKTKFGLPSQSLSDYHTVEVQIGLEMVLQVTKPSRSCFIRMALSRQNLSKSL